jgi:hypothetical protein
MIEEQNRAIVAAELRYVAEELHQCVRALNAVVNEDLIARADIDRRSATTSQP